jgi:hypothetical protein
MFIPLVAGSTTYMLRISPISASNSVENGVMSLKRSQMAYNELTKSRNVGCNKSRLMSDKGDESVDLRIISSIRSCIAWVYDASVGDCDLG